jgi:gentisate 1,2-dioxygenase
MKSSRTEVIDSMNTQTESDPYATLTDLSVAPAWRIFENLMPDGPAPQALPHRWRYSELRPMILHFSKTVGMEDAERRVLVLISPGDGGLSSCLDTLQAGLQIVMPGETARAHRHAANALRFVIEGSGAYTTVDGERLDMRPGDLCVTPGWRFHDHTHEGEGPMIWLDGLDQPLVNKLGASFFESFNARTQPLTRADALSVRQYIHGRLNPAWMPSTSRSTPIGCYPWSETERAFEAMGADVDGSDVDGIVLEYTNPLNGGPIMPTIGCRVQRLLPGFRGRAHRHTSNVVYHVIRGSGTTVVDGEPFDWSEKDIFTLPSWVTHAHENGSSTEDAILFCYSDEPVFRALDLYREELED